MEMNPTNSLDSMLSRCKIQYPGIERPKINLKIVREFLNSGAELQVIEDRGTHCIPSVFWDVKLIEFFLYNGLTDLDASDEISGNTALIYAASYQLKDSVKFLLEHSADPNVRNFNGETALYRLVAFSGRKNSSQSKRTAIAKMLVESGADVTAMTKYGSTLFHDKGFDPKIFGFLLDKLENPDVAASKSGNTPLMEAARRGDVELCRLLIKRNADVNAKNAEGYTPLHYAVFSNSFQCVKLLLSSGSNPNTKSDSGLDAYNMYRSVMYRSIMLPTNKPLKKSSIVEAFQDPIRTVEALELEGAWFNLDSRRKDAGSKLWEKALEKRSVLNLPKPELSPKKKYVFKVQDYFRTKQELDNLKENEVSRQALLIIDEISNGSSWYLLRGIRYLLSSGYKNDFELACEMLRYLDENVDPKEMADTVDEFNTDTLCGILVSIFLEVWHLRMFIDNARIIPDNLLSFVSKICISYFKNLSLRNEFGTDKLAMASLLCNTLVGRRDREISKTRSDLIKEVLNLGLRDGANGDTLLHQVCEGFPIDVGLARVLISCGAEVTALNARGEEPIQMIRRSILQDHIPFLIRRFIWTGSKGADSVSNLVRILVENGADPAKSSLGPLESGGDGSLEFYPTAGLNTVPYLSLKSLAARALCCYE